MVEATGAMILLPEREFVVISCVSTKKTPQTERRANVNDGTTLKNKILIVSVPSVGECTFVLKVLDDVVLGDVDDCQVEVISVGFKPILSTVLQKLELQQQKKKPL